MIHLSQPAFLGNERLYVADALDRSQLSAGEYVARFEAAFAEKCGVPHAVACASGTAALHLLMLGLGVKPGDEVIVPDLTYVATANAVAYCGGRPVFADVGARTWTLDGLVAERALSGRTVGVVAVHLYGMPAMLEELRQFANRRRLWLVEDAAEAVGAWRKGGPVGSLATGAAFSFYGNKIITCGEGGMVTTNDDGLAAHVRLLRGQGVDPDRRYVHTAVGYNYRMTELQAAVGLAQLECLGEHLRRRERVAGWYAERMPADVWGTWRRQPDGDAEPVHWLAVMRLPDGCKATPELVAARLAEAGVETRPVFPPLHAQPIYAGEWADAPFPVADDCHARGLCLPLHAAMTEADVAHVCDAVKAALEDQP
jgi:perosamine synthetase